ncbi:hypothetical protein Tco_1293732 [Tanacetum coccineum]
MKCKVGTLMEKAISLMGRSESVFCISSKMMYQLPPEPSLQEAFEGPVMNFILNQEERVKQLKEYIEVIRSDFMQLSLKTMSKCARSGKSTRGQSSRSQEPIMEDKIREFEVFDNDTHQGHYFTISRLPIHPGSVIDRAFLATHGWRVGLYSEEQSRLGSTKSGLLSGETVKTTHVLMGFWPTIGIARSFGLLTIAMVDALSVEPQAHVFNNKSLIAMGVLMDLGGETYCWPATHQIRDDDEVEEAANKEARGFANIYRNMT